MVGEGGRAWQEPCADARLCDPGQPDAPRTRGPREHLIHVPPTVPDPSPRGVSWEDHVHGPGIRSACSGPGLSLPRLSQSDLAPLKAGQVEGSEGLRNGVLLDCMDDTVLLGSSGFGQILSVVFYFSKHFQIPILPRKRDARGAAHMW